MAALVEGVCHKRCNFPLLAAQTQIKNGIFTKNQILKTKQTEASNIFILKLLIHFHSFIFTITTYFIRSQKKKPQMTNHTQKIKTTIYNNKPKLKIKKT